MMWMVVAQGCGQGYVRTHACMCIRMYACMYLCMYVAVCQAGNYF